MSYAMYCRLNCHVGESDVTVIRKVHKWIRPTHQHGRQWRKDRHKIYRTVLKEHHAAQALFRRYRF